MADQDQGNTAPADCGSGRYLTDLLPRRQTTSTCTDRTTSTTRPSVRPLPSCLPPWPSQTHQTLTSASPSHVSRTDGEDEEDVSAPLESSSTVDSHSAAPAANPTHSSSTSTLPTHASLPANPNSLAFSKKVPPPTLDGSLGAGSAGGNGGGGPTLRPSEMEGEGFVYFLPSSLFLS